MTSSIVHGDPGSFKTATLVSQYGIPALYKGRTVVTNIRGFNDLEKIQKVYKKPLPEGAKIEFVPFTRDGFEQMARFFHWAPQGALILMDEAQRIYPTRITRLSPFDCNPPRPTGYVDPGTGQEENIATVEEAFDCHRHMNWDIYLSTPNIEKVHKEIRQVSEFGFRQKGYKTIMPALAFILGDFKRVKHNAENKGVGASQTLVATSHRIDKRAFKCYESTATGKAKETDTKSSLLGDPKLLLFIGLILIALVMPIKNTIEYGSPVPFGSASNKPIEENTVSESDIFSNSKTNDLVVSSGDSAPVSLPAGHVSDGVPIKDAALDALKNVVWWTGSIKAGEGDPVYFFELKKGDRYMTIDSNELAYLNISVKALRNLIILYTDSYSRPVYPARFEFIEIPKPIDPQITNLSL